MTYKLYLDDTRDLPSGEGWVLARGPREFMELLEKRGCPQHVDFDYYLYDRPGMPTGLDMAQELLFWLSEEDVKVPEDFTYAAHSSDDEMSRKIVDAMKRGLAQLRGEKCPVYDAHPPERDRRMVRLSGKKKMVRH